VDASGEQERFVATIERKDMPTMGDTVYLKPSNGHHAFHSVSGERL
jgi:multiple sugar transport system ATP-binding protein